MNPHLAIGRLFGTDEYKIGSIVQLYSAQFGVRYVVRSAGCRISADRNVCADSQANHIQNETAASR